MLKILILIYLFGTLYQIATNELHPFNILLLLLGTYLLLLGFLHGSGLLYFSLSLIIVYGGAISLFFLVLITLVPLNNFNLRLSDVIALRWKLIAFVLILNTMMELCIYILGTYPKYVHHTLPLSKLTKTSDLYVIAETLFNFLSEDLILLALLLTVSMLGTILLIYQGRDLDYISDWTVEGNRKYTKLAPLLKKKHKHSPKSTGGNKKQQ